MGKKSRLKAKTKRYSEDEEETLKKKHKYFIDDDNDDDDDEANEDLSLKIVEKAMSRSNSRNVDTSSVQSVEDSEIVASEIVKKKKKIRKKKKVKKVENEIELVTPTKEETMVDATQDVNLMNLPESDAVDNNTPDNTVLRRLLRGPRYFDPPDKSWGACFNCGEEGHSAVNCTSARKKKPCFICGSLEHGVKQCQKGQDCYICKGGGHRAKDCPKKFKRSSQASELCLKCGDIAHVMFSCKNDYSPDDLKEIQCYVCKRFGHLCCVDYIDTFSNEASCYKCGQSGHNGLECRGSRGETSAGGTPTSSCYKCGEEGHFVRDCTNSSKGKKRTRDLSTPTKKHSKDNKASKGYNSAPRDREYDNRTPKRYQFDNGTPNRSSKSKRRGGWIPDDSYDLPPINGWRSPSTPNMKRKSYGSVSGGQGSNSRSPKRWNNYGSGSNSRSYANGHQHRFSASRFGNSSSDGMKRHYDYW